jgi:predicted nuclease of predicted toxin-antitoxin system
VKFLIDAQLPRRLARELVDLGHDVIHTLDLPAKNATKDGEVTAVADRGQRIVVTKDSDFRDNHLLGGKPAHLLHVTTGNITNNALLELFGTHLGEITGDQLTPEQVKALVTALRGIVDVLADAEPADKSELYDQLGISLAYNPDGTVTVESRPRGVEVCVGGGT